MYIVYKTTNTKNGMIYVGVHKSDNTSFDGYFGSNKHLHRSIKKYGKQEFVRETLFADLSKEEAYDIEELLVDESFISRKDVYNEKCGGFGGSCPGREFHQNEDYRKRLSDGVKKYVDGLAVNDIPHHNAGRTPSEETRYKMSAAHIGKHVGDLNHMYGISYEDHPKGMLGKIHSQESRDKISKAGIERYKTSPPYERTSEIKKKISDAKRGCASPLKGIPLSEETKSKLRKPKSERMCPHCGKIGRGGNMVRYHFDNCKAKHAE